MPRLPTKLEHQTIPITHGQTATCTLLVYNPGQEVDHVMVSADGPLAPWVAISPLPLPLAPGSEGRLDVVITLPADAAVPAGTHPVLLEARSQVPGTEPSIEELDVDVPRRTSAWLSLGRGDDGEDIVYEATVDNASNHPVQLVIDAAAGVRTVVEPRNIEVPPFSSRTAAITLHPEPDHGRRIELTVRARGDAVDLTESTVWKQSPFPPAWLPAWAGVPLAALAALGAAAVATRAVDAIGEDRPAVLEVTHEVPVGPRPLELEFAFDSIWVTHADGELWRIDPATGSTVADPVVVGAKPLNLLPSPGDGVLWIADPEGERIALVAVGGATGPSITHLPIGREVLDLAAGAGALWVSTLREGEVLRVVPSLPPETWFDMERAADIAFADGSIWGTDSAGRLVRISSTVAHTLEAEVPLDGYPVAVVEAFDDMWVTVTADVGPDVEEYDDPAQVVRVDATTNEVVATIDTPGRPWGLAVGDGVVWAVGRGVTDATADGWAAAIDPGGNEVIAERSLGSSLDGIAFDGEALWVADAPRGMLYRVELQGG